MTDTELEDLFLACWDWHTWMRNGSMPPDEGHGVALTWLRGFAAGRWTPAEREAIFARARPIEKFDDPSTWTTGPPRSDVTGLKRAVNA